MFLKRKKRLVFCLALSDQDEVSSSNPDVFCSIESAGLPFGALPYKMLSSEQGDIECCMYIEYQNEAPTEIIEYVIEHIKGMGFNPLITKKWIE